MKKLLFVVLSYFSIAAGSSQSLKKYDIGNSGCTIYSFCDPVKFDVTYSEDSAKVFTSECKGEDVFYGIICIKLTEEISPISTAETTLVSYLDFLKSAFKITSAAGYGKGHRLQGKENTRGIIDYWKDDEKNNWKVKGWTDGKYIAVLYTYSLTDLPDTKVNAFLNGINFKGM